MRIVTRPDFDGVVCAVLIINTLKIKNNIYWVEPGDMQKGLVEIQTGDIIANLPYDRRCALWFDHHYSNRIDCPFKGLYRVAPSAAGLVYEYYHGRFSRDFSELVFHADKIDTADLTAEEVRHPEDHPYLILSMTITGHERKDEPYWNRLVDLLGEQPIESVMQDTEVVEKCRETVRHNQAYESFLKQYTRVIGQVAVTDFRPLDIPPTGNRFLVYSLFPECVVHVKIRHNSRDKDKTLVSIGHSIFNRHCNVNVGAMLSDFGGGGHHGAGACSFSSGEAEERISAIIEILVKNKG